MLLFPEDTGPQVSVAIMVELMPSHNEMLRIESDRPDATVGSHPT